MYIYKITNQINGKSYIGLDTHSKENMSRWKTHCRNRNCIQGHLYNAFRKYGIENFICDIIDEASSLSELISKEVYWIKKYNTFVEGYNNSPGGELALPINAPVEQLEEINKIRSNIMKNVNKKRWEATSNEERKLFAATHLHTEKANARRSKTITDEWANMSEARRAKKLRGLKTQWDTRTIEEKHKITSRGGNLFTPKKWKIVWKDGTEELLESGLSQFCKKHNLISQNVRGYADKDKFYKDLFKVYRIDD